MIDIKIFAKIQKERETTRIYSQDLRMEFDIEKCTILIMKKGKREATKAERRPNTWRNRLPVLWNIKYGHHLAE